MSSYGIISVGPQFVPTCCVVDDDGNIVFELKNLASQRSKHVAEYVALNYLLGHIRAKSMPNLTIYTGCGRLASEVLGGRRAQIGCTKECNIARRSMAELGVDLQMYVPGDVVVSRGKPSGPVDWPELKIK